MVKQDSCGGERHHTDEEAGLQGAFLSLWGLFPRKGLAFPCLHEWKLTGLFMGLSHTLAPQLEGNQRDFLISSPFLAVAVKGVLGRER